jgi:DNA polymerase-3 subunit beta
MRFTCQVTDLVDGLSVASRALSARTTQPILEGVLIKTGEDSLKLTCSDGSISIVTQVSAEIEEDGDLVLPGKLFLEVMRKLPQGEMKASSNDSFAMTVRCQGSRTTIAGQNPANYPALPLVSAQNSFILPQKLLREMIEQTSFATSSDETRMVLTGSLMEIEKGELRMVALDGFRLALRLERLSGDAADISAIIPQKALTEIARVMADDESRMAMILIGGNQLMINMDSTQFYTTLIDGEFIEYRRIIPKEWKTRAKVQTDAMARCVERASLMAREGRNNLIRMSVSEGSIVITANSESGDVYEELEAEVEGEALDIAFNVRYMMDVLRAVKDEEIFLRFNSSVSPCLIGPVEGDAYTYLVLPVRVHA